MANLQAKDGAAATKYLKATGAGTDLDPHIVEHEITQAAHDELNLNANLQEGLAAATRVFGLMDREPEIADAPGAVTLAPLAREISYAGVNFGYDGRENVLHDINFAVRRCEVVALVGPSGAGKSTLLNLLPRFYEVTAGAIMIDGHDIRAVTLASLRGQPDIAVGNVLGSNIFNIALILGLSALIVPLPIRGNVVRLEWPIMFLASAAFAVVARDGLLDRLEAGLFVAAMTAFIGYSVWIARREVAGEEAREFKDEVEARSSDVRRETMLSVGAVVLGLLLLLVGGRLLVDGAVNLARLAGLSERIIGLTIVAAGTSAPEVATSIVAAVRKQTDVAVANIIGSNIFNLRGILGTPA